MSHRDVKLLLFALLPVIVSFPQVPPKQLFIMQVDKVDNNFTDKEDAR